MSRFGACSTTGKIEARVEHIDGTSETVDTKWRDAHLPYDITVVRVTCVKCGAQVTR